MFVVMRDTATADVTTDYLLGFFFCYKRNKNIDDGRILYVRTRLGTQFKMIIVLMKRLGHADDNRTRDQLRIRVLTSFLETGRSTAANRITIYIKYLNLWSRPVEYDEKYFIIT